MNAWAQGEGQPGLGYIFWRDDESEGMEAAGPIAKTLGPERTEAIRAQLGLARATPPSSSPATREASTSSPAWRAPSSARS